MFASMTHGMMPFGKPGHAGSTQNMTSHFVGIMLEGPL
jgi:hypothetical protein